MLEESCVPVLLFNRAQQHPRQVALLEKRLGKWVEYTWEEYWRAVEATALGLAEIGVERGEAVVVIGENSPQWLFVDLGVQILGGFTVGVFPTTPVSELAYILSDCRARVVVVGDQEQADKVLEVMNQSPNVQPERLIYIEPKGVSSYDLEFLSSFADLVARGRQLAGEQGRSQVQRWLSERTLDEICLVGYTSGTTGLPKGVMISHRAMVEMTKSFAEAFSMDAKDRIVAWVSVAHPAIRGPQVYTPFRNGARLAFPESADTFAEALYEIAPTYIMCPPRYLEVMAADIQTKMMRSTRFKRAMFSLGMRMGEAAATEKWAKGRLGPIGLCRRWLSWVLVGKPVLEKLGLDHVRWALAGGAAISRDLVRFFHSLGFELRQVFGQSETVGVSFAQYLPGPVRPGTAGVALPRMEARIADDGELLVRGPGLFSGYLNQPEKTSEVLDADGWFHTGDLAEFTPDGELVLLERESAMATLADGRRLAPTEIENALKFSPYISEAVVIADRRPYPTALIQIELDTVADWAQRQGYPFTTFRSLTELEPVQELVAGEVRRVNERLRDLAIIDFRLLPKELDVDDDELTPTRKVKRRVINDKFAALIESMYQPDRSPVP
ncbi:MAG: long-chain-fatty-acid--CoA ligase [Acidimicrobiia bacterium]|nr:MAG: long-chain-fatty-acid--CoA ligase [Acidimicrobiia bacterium]